MRETHDYPNPLEARKGNREEILDLVRIFSLMLSKWYFFILALILSFFCARVYINHTLPVYKVTASILVTENQSNTSLNEQLFQGMGLNPGARNIQNQIMVLKSRTVTERALNFLPFEIDFYLKTLRNKLPIYPEIPVRITLLTGEDLPRNIEFVMTYMGDSLFHLATTSKKNFEFNSKSYFGDTLIYPKGSFKIDAEDSEWLEHNVGKKFYFTIHERMSLVRFYNRRLIVEPFSREGTSLKISLEGTNPAKDVDFINYLTDVFVALSLDKKNLEAARRIQFIDDQLVDISDSLVLTENRLQQFRSRNRVMDLSTQGQAIIAQSIDLENQRARIAVETNYYDYLAEYLEKDISDEMVVAPATMGITDPGLTRLVAELATLQGQLSTGSLGELNPLQSQLIQRIRATREALLETLNGLRRANSMAVEENLSQIRRINSQAAALPGTERQLLGIERKFRLNDELYTFLLERRAEQQMQKASNMPDDEVVDYANKHDSVLVSPKKTAVYLIAWFLGLAFPGMIIFLTDIVNKTVKIEDFNRITFFPVAGKIPHSSNKTSLVVFEKPESSVAEAFRILRSKMQFFTKEAKSPVILLTSSLPDDGKTFTAINLASAYSLLGRKTVLIGFDLRKPKIFDDFDLDNESGVTTFLIGRDKLQDIIKSTKFENLSVITAGPIPPNPSELSALPKTEELINLLKKQFDCIIIDSSPIGLVSDTYYIAAKADLCLLVVRLGRTLKDVLEKTINEIKISDLKNISLVLNDLPLDEKSYGYGGRYGYTNDSGKGNNQKTVKKLLSKRPLKKIENKTDISGNQWRSKI
jgi:capsular exopolysaccharide synthesis family protein